MTARQTANLANAQHSTGPRTPEGKAAVSLNANRHNLTGRLLIRDDEREAFTVFEATHLAQLKPLGALEVTVFEQLLAAAWNLLRIETLEAQAFAQGSLADETIGRQLDRLCRYRGQHQRTFHRALRELKELQTTREIVERQEDQLKPDFNPLADLARVKRVGFVLSGRAKLLRAWVTGSHDSTVKPRKSRRASPPATAAA